MELKLEYLDRILEVAKAGQHSVLITTDDPEGIKDYSDWADLEAVKPCPCGNLGHPIKSCRCEPSDINIWQTQFPKTDMYAEIMIMPSRIDLSDERLDKQSLELLEMGIKQLVLNYSQVKSVLNVAKTICKLNRESKIKASHIAEALQYREK